MNQFEATLTQIENVEMLHALTFAMGTQTIHLVSLELNSRLKVGDLVTLSVNSTDIALAKNFSGLLSYTNQFNMTVTKVNNGRLLSSIVLEMNGVNLEVIITLKASLEMNLEVGDEVVALIRETAISILG